VGGPICPTDHRRAETATCATDVRRLDRYGPLMPFAASLPFLIATLLCFAAIALERRVARRLGAQRAARDAAHVLRRAAGIQRIAADQRLRHLERAVDDVFWETDAALRLRHVSSGFERAAGRDPRTLLGRNPVEVAERLVGRPGRAAAWLGAMRARRPVRALRLAWRDRGGTVRIWLVHGDPVFDEAQRFAGYRGVAVDASDCRIRRRMRGEARRP